jgi:AraC-like DNA-binding protein
MAAAAMRYREHPIHPSLAAFVKCVWSLESDEAIFNATPERILPDGCVELVFHFASPFRSGYAGSPTSEQPRSMVVGQMRRFIEIQPHGRVGLIAVRFHVRGAYLFFPGPLSEIANRDVELVHVWGRFAQEVADRISKARDTAARASVVETALLKQARHHRADPLVNRALHLIEMHGGQINVAEMTSLLGASSRQLARRFDATVGVSPKEFSRVTRFLRAVRKLDQGGHGTLTETALECGYFDQAHFNHEFREFAGITPREFHAFPNLAF